jgi:hypothetical protein
MSDLDHCPVCGGVHLVRRLGETECRDCGMVRDPGDAADGAAVHSGDPVPDAGQGGRAPSGSLAEDVERALDRVLGHTRRTGALR